MCIIASIIGTFFVRLGANQSIMGALYKGMLATAILSLIGIAGVTNYVSASGRSPASIIPALICFIAALSGWWSPG